MIALGLFLEVSEGRTCMKNHDCFTADGSKFMGKLSGKSKSGRTCVSPCKKLPIQGRDTVVFYCHTNDPKRRVDYCDVPSCDDCDQVIEDSETKKQYLALDKDDEQTYKKKVQEMLPTLLMQDKLQAGEIGIAKLVTDPKSVYPALALLKGEDIVEKRTKNKVLSVNGTVVKMVKKRGYSMARYRPTGLYAPPGDIITLTIPKDLVNKIGVLIGQDTINQIKFMPLQKVTQKIGSPYGGLIIIYLKDISATRKIKMFDISVDNAIEAPYFVLGEDTNDDWNKMKHSASPWTVLRIPGRVHVYIQTLHVKSVNDMEKVMDSSVKKLWDVVDDLIGIDGNILPGEEQVHLTPYLTDAGRRWGKCWGGGKSEIRATNDNAKKFLFKGWLHVLFHELGHGFCYADLPDMGNEWTAELVAEYIWRVMHNHPMHIELEQPTSVLHRMITFKMFNQKRSCMNAFKREQYPAGNISYIVDDYNNCWTTLYRLPLWEFGFDTLRQVLTADADSKIEYLSSTDRMADLFCKATKHNLIPMFNFYNIKVSPSIADPCRKQKSPALITNYLKIANCILTKDIMECAKMPEFPEHKGICRFNGVCQRDPDNGNKRTEFKNKFDTWGMTAATYHIHDRKMIQYAHPYTMQKKFFCHKRAKDVFSQCSNKETQPITATFTSKDGDSTSETFPKQVIEEPKDKGNCYMFWQLPLRKFAGYSHTDMDPAMCNKMCLKRNYTHFGIFSGVYCYCSNTAPTQKRRSDMTRCDIFCSGNSLIRCGGRGRMNAWPVCQKKECTFTE